MRTGKSGFRSELLFALLSSCSNLALSVILRLLRMIDVENNPASLQKHDCPLEDTIKPYSFVTQDWLIREKNMHSQEFDVILLGGCHNTRKKNSERLQLPLLTSRFARYMMQDGPIVIGVFLAICKQQKSVNRTASGNKSNTYQMTVISQ